jgi:hypothetical protein
MMYIYTYYIHVCIMQAKNLCILAKFGNKFKALSEFPTSNCAGHTQRGITPQVLYIYTYMHICIYTYIHIYMYTYIHIYT